MLIEYLLYRQNVIGRTHERVSDEVDVFLNGEEDVVVVFRRDGRQSDVLARHVNALVRTKHVEFAVVEEHMVANLNVLGEVDVRNVYDVVRRIHTRTTEYLNDIACLVLYRLGAASGSHLRTLCVDHKGKVGRNRSYILYNITYPVACAVFIRTTFIPAKNNLRRNSTSQRRSLIEATIFVCFIVCIFICFSYAKLLIFLEKPPIFTTHKILNMCNS